MGLTGWARATGAQAGMWCNAGAQASACITHCRFERSENDSAKRFAATRSVARRRADERGGSTRTTQTGPFPEQAKACAPASHAVGRTVVVARGARNRARIAGQEPERLAAVALAEHALRLRSLGDRRDDDACESRGRTRSAKGGSSRDRTRRRSRRRGSRETPRPGSERRDVGEPERLASERAQVTREPAVRDVADRERHAPCPGVAPRRATWSANRNGIASATSKRR